MFFYSFIQYYAIFESWILKHSLDTAETETEVAEKSSWDQANRGEKLGLVWRNRKKISQIINDYLCLPFFLLIILWYAGSLPSDVTFEIFLLCRSFSCLYQDSIRGLPWSKPRLKLVQTGSSPPPTRTYITGGVTNPDEFYFLLKTAFPEYTP